MGEMVKPSGYELNRQEARLAMAHFYVAFLALFLGGIAGLLQGLVRGGLITLPGGISYYQLLTAHGVLLALVLTTAPKIWGSSSQKQKNTHLSHLRWLFMEIWWFLPLRHLDPSLLAPRLYIRFRSVSLLLVS